MRLTVVFSSATLFDRPRLATQKMLNNRPMEQRRSAEDHGGADQGLVRGYGARRHLEMYE